MVPTDSFVNFLCDVICFFSCKTSRYGQENPLLYRMSFIRTNCAAWTFNFLAASFPSGSMSSFKYDTIGVVQLSLEPIFLLIHVVYQGRKLNKRKYLTGDEHVFCWCVLGKTVGLLVLFPWDLNKPGLRSPTCFLTCSRYFFIHYPLHS